MPTDEIVNQIFSSTDFLLKKHEAKVAQIYKLAPAYSFIFKKDAYKPVPNEINYMAIDGTESVDSKYDLLVFYAGAFGYAGKLVKDFSGNLFMSEESSIKIPTEISMAIPMHEGDVVDVLEKSEILPADFPPLLMELSELALARSVARQGVDLLLLDRSLSLEYSHLFADALDFSLRKPSTFFEADDIKMAFNLIPSPSCPPQTGPQLNWCLIRALSKRPSSWSDVAQQIGIQGNERLARESISELESSTGLKILGDGPTLLERFASIDERLEKNIDMALDHILFNSNGHPLWKDGKWIQEGEIRLLSFLVLRSLLGLSYEKKILLIGIIKESSSTDFMTKVCGKLAEAGKLTGLSPSLGTDTVYLSSLSDALGISTPWRTLEFDAHLHGENTPAGLFAKGYFKLVSSYFGRVFQYDRPFYLAPPLDDWIEGDPSWVGDGIPAKVISYLEPMAKEAIPEALGYNYPLFLADKKAKTMQAEARRAYLSAVDFELNKMGMFSGSGKYRDMRKYYEQMRRRNAIV